MVWFVSRRQGWFVNEGFDDARRDTLFLTMPFSRKGTLVQYAGRLHRLHPSKEDVRIYRYAARHALRSDDLEPREVRAIARRIAGQQDQARDRRMGADVEVG